MMKIFPSINDCKDLTDLESVGCACGCGEEGEGYRNGFHDGIEL